MKHSFTAVSNILSYAAVLVLVPHALAAPNEQLQTEAKQGSVSQSQAELGTQSGSAIQSGAVPSLVPPSPENPTQVVSHTVAKDDKDGGIPLGNFLLYPELSATMMYDDNIYASRINELSDRILTISPEIRMKSNLSRHFFELGTGVDINQYHKYTDENTNDAWVYGKGRIDISDWTNIYGGVNLSRDHEDRSSPDASEISTTDSLEKPTHFRDLSGNAGIHQKLTDRLNIRFGVSAMKLNYEDTPLVGGGTYSSDYRDRQETLVGGRVTFAALDGVNLFAQGMSDTRAYDTSNPITNPTFNHNSHGYNEALGISFKPSSTLNAEAYVGLIQHYYDNSLFENISATDYGLNVMYKIAPWTTLSLNLDRSLKETTITDLSGYLNTALTGQVKHNLSRDLSLNASLSRQWSSYNESEREDVYTGAGVGAKYYITNSFYAGADYKYRHRNSTATQSVATYIDPVHYADYDNNLVYVTLGTDFGTRANSLMPAITYPSWDLFPVPFSNNLSGLYIGAALGMNSISNDSFGYRDTLTDLNNYDDGEFSKTGKVAGLFAGYGLLFNKHYYLGLEAEYDHGSDKITHDHVNDSYFSIEQADNLAITLRPGYVVNNGSLLYGRLGYASTTFENAVRVLDDSVVPGVTYSVNQNEKVSGVKLGMGTDIPVSDNFFMRMDYAYTDYKSYDVPVFNSAGTLLQNDTADMSSGTFKIGLGWNFGGSDDATNKVASVDANYLNGMYVGAMIGHGVISSEMEAIQKQGDVNQSVLLANFGNEGFTGGAFLGYGYTFHQFYVGAELEAEAATFGWHHDRTVSGDGGRDFNVHKKGGFGESIRLGYVLKNASLLYARVGLVNTKFNSIYERGAASGSPKYIDQDNELDGTRIGLGAEVPFNKSLFMRMDYSYTNYESYSFVTAHSSPDAITYNNDENMVRFGLGYHF